MTIINNNKNKLEELEQYQNKSWLQKIKHNLKKIYSSKETGIGVRAVCKTSGALLFSALLASFWGRESEKQYVKNYMKFEGAPTEINHIDSNETEAIDMLTQIKNNTKTLASFKTLYKSIKREDLKDDAELTNKQIEDILRKGFDKHKSERRYISLLVTILLAGGVMGLAGAGVVAYKLGDNQYNKMMQDLSDMLDQETVSLATAKDKAQSDAIGRLASEKSQLQNNLNEWKQKFEESTNKQHELGLIEIIQQTLNTNDNPIGDKITTIINEATKILTNAKIQDLTEKKYLNKNVTTLEANVDNKLHELNNVQRNNIKENNSSIGQMMQALQISYNQIIQQEQVQEAVKTFVDGQKEAKDAMIEKLQKHNDLNENSIKIVTDQRNTFEETITGKMEKAQMNGALNETNKIIAMILYGNSKDNKSFDDYLKSQNIDIDKIIQEATDTIEKQKEAEKEQAEKEQRITTVKKILTDDDKNNINMILSKLPFAKEEDMEKIEAEFQKNKKTLEDKKNNITLFVNQLVNYKNKSNRTDKETDDLIQSAMIIFDTDQTLEQSIRELDNIKNQKQEAENKMNTINDALTTLVVDKKLPPEEQLKLVRKNKEETKKLTTQKKELQDIIEKTPEEIREATQKILEDITTKTKNIGVYIKKQQNDIEKNYQEQKTSLGKVIEESLKIQENIETYIDDIFVDLSGKIKQLLEDGAEFEEGSDKEKKLIKEMKVLQQKQNIYTKVKEILEGILIVYADQEVSQENLKQLFWKEISKIVGDELLEYENEIEDEIEFKTEETNIPETGNISQKPIIDKNSPTLDDLLTQLHKS